MKLDNKQILELYKSASDENLRFVDLTLSRIRFFLGLVTAIVAGTIAGIFKAEHWYHLLLMSIGPVLVFYICKISNDGVLHAYRLFLESVTVRFKLAQRLGLANKQENNELELVWGQEPILPARHIPSEQDFRSSSEWIDDAMGKLPSLWFLRIFRGARILSVVLLVAILAFAYTSYENTANKAAQEGQPPSSAAS
jgi:hypothetical protein